MYLLLATLLNTFTTLYNLSIYMKQGDMFSLLCSVICFICFLVTFTLTVKELS